MPVNDIIKKIKQETNRKAEDILEREKKKAKKKTTEIQKEKEKKLGELKNEREREIKTMRNRIISQAKLEKQKKKLKVREKMIDKVFDRVHDELEDTDPSRYEDFLRQAIGKASGVFEGKTIIHCSSKSEEIVKQLAQKIDPSLQIKSDLKTIGGIIAESESGAKIDMTFESNVERRKREFRKDISDILFSDIKEDID
ncbi:MAG: V-type ATP synthase subunit E [Candidatus Saliniplasma sp.]